MMFFSKKYINILLCVLLCILSTDAAAEQSVIAKNNDSSLEYEAVRAANKSSKQTKKANKKAKKQNKKNKKKRKAQPSNQYAVTTGNNIAQTAAKSPSSQPSETKSTETLRRDTLTRLEKIRERGVINMTNTFVSKGSWIGGVGASFSQHINDNYTLAIIDGIVSEGYTFRVSAMGAYAIRSNMALGLRGTYNRTNLTMNNANLQFGDSETGTQININSFKAVQHTYSAAIIWRQYIPLGQSKRFAIFNEISLGGGATQSIFAADQPIKGTYEEGYNISLGVSPGLIAFATNDIAIEVNVGVMGVTFSDVKQVHNQIYTGNRQSSNMNFKVNLLSIGVGVSFYL